MTVLDHRAAAPTGAGTDTYATRLLSAWTAAPERSVVLWSGETLGAGVVREWTLRTADALRGAGVGPGTTVAVLTVANHPAMLVTRWAAHLLGATVVHVRSMNPRTDEIELPVEVQADVLVTTRPRVLVADAGSSDRARLLVERAPGPSVLVLAGPPTGCSTGARDLTAMPTPVAVSPEACAVVDFTSGTRNAPKLVAQSWAARERLVTRLAGDPGPPARLLSVTPISHTTAPMIDAVLCSGGSVVLHPGFDVDDVLHAVAEQGVTDLYLAVPHLMALLDDPRLQQTDLTRLRRVVYSGTPSAAWRIRQAIGAFGPSLVQVYGTTETGGISALTAEDHLEPELHGTVGRPFPWVEVEIREPDRTPSASGRTGELWVRSETTMTGYLGSEAPLVEGATDGWIATGDLGRWDRHGYLELRGRVGGVIKTGGLKIYPAAVESVLAEHPAVHQVVVDARRGCDSREYVHATISCSPGSCTEDELRAHVAARLSDAHAPTEFTFWAGLPLTPSGKPDYRRLRAERPR